MSRPASRDTDVVLLDGGMGQELIRRGVRADNSLWSANALISAPETVQAVHEDYIARLRRLIDQRT